MSDRPTATALAITQRHGDNSRSLHFATDQGPIVVRCDDADDMEMWADMLREEAEEWAAEADDEADEWTDDDETEGARP
jgi:hypothetical protein